MFSCDEDIGGWQGLKKEVEYNPKIEIYCNNLKSWKQNWCIKKYLLSSRFKGQKPARLKCLIANRPWSLFNFIYNLNKKGVPVHFEHPIITRHTAIFLQFSVYCTYRYSIYGGLWRHTWIKAYKLQSIQVYKSQNHYKLQFSVIEIIGGANENKKLYIYSKEYYNLL